ncbi:PGM2 protein, partial [Neodrepanis coruscans]|nr:PGM2 protein [Neodrepanis coruscans]
QVYWENGAQIISPHDKEISQAIEENQEPWPQAWDDKLIDGSLLLRDPYAMVNKEYFKDIQKQCFYRSINKETNLKFVHTSVHGVGHKFVQLAFKAFDLSPPFAVPEQKDPDPDFPTTLSFALAEKDGARIILANDPDADRLAVAEKQDRYGNKEMQAIDIFYSKARLICIILATYIYMLSSTVSSKILRAIALKEGFHFEVSVVLHIISLLSYTLMDQGKAVLFAFEEAIGYMCCPAVLDKDGVSAAVITAEMASFLATRNLSLSQQLRAVYDEYGFHINKASYFICHDPEIIQQLFDNLRNFDGRNTYPKSCGRFKVSGIRDLTTGYDSSQPDQKAILPTSKSSQMITFTFANGGVATMRTSGTEPKIKYYSELCAPPGNSDVEQLKKELDELVNALEKHFFQPEKNKLQRKTE